MNNDELIEELIRETVGSCTCMTKAPYPDAKHENCTYGALMRAIEYIRWRDKTTNELQDRVEDLLIGISMWWDLDGIIDETITALNNSGSSISMRKIKESIENK